MDYKYFLPLLVALMTGLDCEQSFTPMPISIDPTENDPVPYFRISYHRSHTNSSNGLTENIQLTLKHQRKGELIDYGRVSFGGVQLFKVSEGSSDDCYYNYLQTGIAGSEFDSKFRFDQENLIFKSTQSSAINDIDTELNIPPVSYMTDVSLNMIVEPNKDWTIRMNKKSTEPCIRCCREMQNRARSPSSNG